MDQCVAAFHEMQTRNELALAEWAAWLDAWQHESADRDDVPWNATHCGLEPPV
jgi:hypothetical protein